MYFLQRHRMPINAKFEWSLVLAYAVPPGVLAPLLPPGLMLDTYKNFGFLAVALVQTTDLRPAFVPQGMGIQFFLCGYRIFTRYTMRSGQTLRGLKVLRTDTNHRAMRFFGNILTHYNYQLSSWEVQRTGEKCSIRISTPDHKADLHVEAALQQEPALPAGSPFDDFDDARHFAGPLPYTFDYERQTNSIIRVEAVREKWNPRPVSVKVHRNGFLEQDAFRDSGAVLANAFYVENVPYGWRRGIRETLW
jgi:uncharacterized protein YqjF (DUF2071 family)